MQEPEFQTGVIKPIECVREAWGLIKKDYWLLIGISIVGAMVGALTVYVLIGAMICGIFTCYFKCIDGEKVVFDDLWAGMKFFRPSLGVTIAIIGPLVAWILTMFVTLYLPLITTAMLGTKADDSTLLATFGVGLAVDVAVAIVMVGFHSLLIFCFPLIVDRGMSSWESMKLSARASLKNMGGIGGMILINMLLAFLGELVFCIGIYLMIPLITAANLVAYRKVFPSPHKRNFDPPPPGAYAGI
jgi:hypothetical protein